MNGKALEMIAVSARDGKDVIGKYMKENGFTFKAASDQKGTGSLVGRFGVGSFPRSYIIGPDGIIVDRIDGFDESRIRRVLAKLGIR